MNKKYEQRKYEQLYSRWLENPTRLLDYAIGPEPDGAKDLMVVDLCGGNGAIAVEAYKRGAHKAFIVDKMPRPGDMVTACSPYISTVKSDGIDYLNRPFIWKHPERPRILPRKTLVICRQGINYLPLKPLAGLLTTQLEPGDIFVFNTFRDPPRVRVKAYTHALYWTLELSLQWFWPFSKKITHVQWVPRIGIDVNSFVYYAHGDYMAAFLPNFDVTYRVRGKSVDYRCIKV